MQITSSADKSTLSKYLCFQTLGNLCLLAMTAYSVYQYVQYRCRNESGHTNWLNLYYFHNQHFLFPFSIIRFPPLNNFYFMMPIFQIILSETYKCMWQIINHFQFRQESFHAVSSNPQSTSSLLVASHTYLAFMSYTWIFLHFINGWISLKLWVLQNK